MKRFLIRLAGREEGPFSDAQIAQMFADRRVDRSTACKPEHGGEWRTIDDYLPTLKYGTQLPAPTRNLVAATLPVGRPSGGEGRVAIIDVDVPFTSVLKILFKWAGAALIVGLCMMPVIMVLWILFVVLFAGVVGGLMSGLPRP